MREYFSKRRLFFWGGGDVKVELDLTNYVTQADF